jgi:hypothetical protein
VIASHRLGAWALLTRVKNDPERLFRSQSGPAFID